MVRVKQLASTERVKLSIKGPKSIVKERQAPVIIETRLNRTWYNLIWRDLGVEVSPTSGVFVCSRKYTPTKPEGSEGWRAELNESIAEFVSKCERRREPITVRICDPEWIAGAQARLGSSATTKTPRKNQTERQNINTTTPSRASRKSETRNISASVRVERRQKNDTGRSSFNSVQSSVSKAYTSRVAGQPNKPMQLRRMGNKFSTPQIVSVFSMVENEAHSSDNWANCNWDESEMDNDDESFGADEDVSDCGQGDHDRENNEHDEDYYDASSLLTAANEEENELRQAGIQVEDVKSSVEGQLPRFSNAFLLRVKREILKLKKDNLWDRNVMRSPLACHLLQEIFK